MKKEIRTIVLMCAIISFLMGCEHTLHGMKQDIHEDTASNPPQTRTVVVKKTNVVYPTPPSQQALPSSPPPMETPPQ